MLTPTDIISALSFKPFPKKGEKHSGLAFELAIRKI
jgi:hypothetical protein